MHTHHLILRTFLILAFLGLAACSTAPPAGITPVVPDGNPLLPPAAGPADPLLAEWVLLEFGPSGAEGTVPSEPLLTLMFEEGGRISGSAGCNHYSGAYILEDGQISIGPLATTRMGCLAPGVMERESAFLRALQTAQSIEMTADSLVLTYQDGQGRLVFTKAEHQSGLPTPVFSLPAEAVTPEPEQPHAASVMVAPSREVYQDDRSGPVEVLQSLVNALNRYEYVRAYSYWENPGQSAATPTFEQFLSDYAETESIELWMGEVLSDVGAGQYYYAVPVAMVVLTRQGETQTFAGCYILHLASPAAQAVPPFRPLGIRSAQLEQVPNDADLSTLVNRDCLP
jgi:heat shock protein HslJ